MVRDTKIAVLGGDGIGPEVTSEAVKVLEATGHDFEFLHVDVGGKAYIDNGNPLPDYAREVIDESDAVLFGAVGHDYAPYGIPRKVLVYLRMEKILLTMVWMLLLSGIIVRVSPLNMRVIFGMKRVLISV
jgi:3-isopropylmalate dehydrogenase